MTGVPRYHEAAEVYRLLARLRETGAPAQVLVFLNQAAMWLEDGPCVDCRCYHESGPCPPNLEPPPEAP